MKNFSLCETLGVDVSHSYNFPIMVHFLIFSSELTIKNFQNSGIKTKRMVIFISFAQDVAKQRVKIKCEGLD